MAPTTAPNVFWTASPTFLAINVPPSSSKAASSNSAAGKTRTRDIRHSHTVRNHIQKHHSNATLSIKKNLPVGIPLLWKQASQTRTGARPQPLSGTGRDLEEQESQKPSPQARQWCLVSLGWNSPPHLWHFCGTQSFWRYVFTLQRWSTMWTVFCGILLLVAYQDKGVGFPVGGSNLVSKPGGDCFGRFDAEFGHWLRNVFDSIQQPLGSVVVVLQKTIRLKRSQEINRVKIQINIRANTLSVVHT